MKSALELPLPFDTKSKYFFSRLNTIFSRSLYTNHSKFTYIFSPVYITCNDGRTQYGMTSNPKYSISGTFTQGTVSDEIADFLLAKTFVAVYLQTDINTNPSTFSQQCIDVSVVQKV